MIRATPGTPITALAEHLLVGAAAVRDDHRVVTVPRAQGRKDGLPERLGRPGLFGREERRVPQDDVFGDGFDDVVEVARKGKRGPDDVLDPGPHALAGPDHVQVDGQPAVRRSSGCSRRNWYSEVCSLGHQKTMSRFGRAILPSRMRALMRPSDLQDGRAAAAVVVGRSAFLVEVGRQHDVLVVDLGPPDLRPKIGLLAGFPDLRIRSPPGP